MSKMRSIIAVVLSGLVLGVLAKLGDVIPQGNILFNFISGFGRVSSGFTFWVYACLLISNRAPSKQRAVLHVVLFLLSMLAAYYSYSKLAVGYLSVGTVKFWLLMVIPAGVASYAVYDIREKKVLKILVALAAVLLGLVSIVFIEGLETYALVIECVLFLLIGRMLFRKKENQE